MSNDLTVTNDTSENVKLCKRSYAIYFTNNCDCNEY